VGRTLIDCASILGPVRLQSVVDEAFHRRLVSVRGVEWMLDATRRAPGRPGEVRLRDALDPWRTRIAAGSPAEHRLRLQLVQWGYPEPELQVPVIAADGSVLGRVDCGWPAVRIGIEYDSERFHGESAWGPTSPGSGRSRPRDGGCSGRTRPTSVPASAAFAVTSSGSGPGRVIRGGR
jgi:hypothetical protein